MATTAAPPVVARPGAAAPGHTIAGLERRGIGAWLTTPDHKKIGILYMVSTLHLLPPRRPRRAAGAHAAGAARSAAVRARDLQPDLHHPRLGDDLPVHHPVRRRRTRQLLRAADDRRARHGVSQDQRAVVLDDPARRPADPVRLLLPRSDWQLPDRRRRRRLDVLSAAQRARAVRPEPVAGRRDHPGHARRSSAR